MSDKPIADSNTLDELLREEHSADAIDINADDELTTQDEQSGPSLAFEAPVPALPASSDFRAAPGYVPPSPEEIEAAERILDEKRAEVYAKRDANLRRGPRFMYGTSKSSPSSRDSGRSSSEADSGVPAFYNPGSPRSETRAIQPKKKLKSIVVVPQKTGRKVASLPRNAPSPGPGKIIVPITQPRGAVGSGYRIVDAPNRGNMAISINGGANRAPIRAPVAPLVPQNQPRAPLAGLNLDQDVAQALGRLTAANWVDLLRNLGGAPQNQPQPAPEPENPVNDQIQGPRKHGMLVTAASTNTAAKKHSVELLSLFQKHVTDLDKPEFAESDGWKEIKERPKVLFAPNSDLGFVATNVVLGKRMSVCNFVKSYNPAAAEFFNCDCDE